MCAKMSHLMYKGEQAPSLGIEMELLASPGDILCCQYFSRIDYVSWYFGNRDDLQYFRFSGGCAFTCLSFPFSLLCFWWLTLLSLLFLTLLLVPVGAWFLLGGRWKRSGSHWWSLFNLFAVSVAKLAYMFLAWATRTLLDTWATWLLIYLPLLFSSIVLASHLAQYFQFYLSYKRKA